jgi:hypothetical protein
MASSSLAIDADAQKRADAIAEFRASVDQELTSWVHELRAREMALAALKEEWAQLATKLDNTLVPDRIE